MLHLMWLCRGGGIRCSILNVWLQKVLDSLYLKVEVCVVRFCMSFIWLGRVCLLLGVGVDASVVIMDARRWH